MEFKYAYACSGRENSTYQAQSLEQSYSQTLNRNFSFIEPE